MWLCQIQPARVAHTAAYHGCEHEINPQQPRAAVSLRPSTKRGRPMHLPSVVGPCRDMHGTPSRHAQCRRDVSRVHTCWLTSTTAMVQTKQQPRQIQPGAYPDSFKPSPTLMRCVLFTIAARRGSGQNPTQPLSCTNATIPWCMYTPQRGGHSPQPHHQLSSAHEQHPAQHTGHAFTHSTVHWYAPRVKTHAGSSVCPPQHATSPRRKHICKDGRHPAPETSPCFVPRLHPGPCPKCFFCCSQPMCPCWPLSSCVPAGPSAA